MSVSSTSGAATSPGDADVGPLRSMTGAGSCVIATDAARIEVEARSVNNRFLKTSVRVHGALPRLDAVVEQIVRKHVERGHVTVHVRARATEVDPTGRIDRAAFSAGASRLRQLATDAQLPAPTMRDVLHLPGVLREERDDSEGSTAEGSAAEGHAAKDNATLALATQAIEGAVKDLVASREREGTRLADEMKRLLTEVQTALTTISERAGEVPAAYKAKLEARLAELLDGTDVTPDPEQLARTCASMADRADIREEIARLEAHIDHAGKLLATARPAGKALDFLVQEFNREVSTIGSKANDLTLSRTALALRADVERMREQVQNVE